MIMKKHYLLFTLPLVFLCLSCDKTQSDEEEYFKKNSVEFNPVSTDDDVTGGKDDTPETGTVIKLDGDFSDWEQEGVVSSDLCVEPYDAIQTIKACMSNKNLYIYIKSNALSRLYNLRIVIDCDGDPATGDSYWAFPETGFSMMFNNSFVTIDGAVQLAHAGAYSLILGGDSSLGNLADACDARTVSDGEDVQIEMSFSRSRIESMLDGAYAFSGEYVRVEAYALDSTWALSAVIPDKSPLYVKVNDAQQ